MTATRLGHAGVRSSSRAGGVGWSVVAVRTVIAVGLLMGVGASEAGWRLFGQLEAMEGLSPDDPFTFRIRRARFIGEEDLGNGRTLVIKLSGDEAKTSLLDAHFSAELGDHLRVRVGRFKKPFSREALRGARKLHTGDRGIVNDLFGENDLALAGHGSRLDYCGRDIGISLRGKTTLWERDLSADIGIFNGRGSDRSDNDDEKVLAGRVEAELTSDLDLGASWSWQAAGAGPLAQAWGMDGRFNHSRLEAWGEVLFGRNAWLPDAPDMIGTTGQLTAKWGNFRPGIRLERVDPVRDVLWNAAWSFTAYASVLPWKGEQLIAEYGRVWFAHDPEAPAPDPWRTFRIVLRMWE